METEVEMSSTVESRIHERTNEGTNRRTTMSSNQVSSSWSSIEPPLDGCARARASRIQSESRFKPQKIDGAAGGGE